MQTIVIQRATPTTDEYGDTVEGTFTDHLTVAGYYAPNNSTEPVEVGRNAVITGATLYVYADSRPDIQPNDRAVIIEGTFNIEGEVGFWGDEYGPVGYQFAIKKVID